MEELSDTGRYAVEGHSKIPVILPFSSAETEETSFGGFVDMLMGHFMKKYLI